MFPDVFMETRNKDGEISEGIDFEKLKAELGIFSDTFEARREHYGMDWPGKKECMKVIEDPSMATLKPCRDESVDFDATGNLFIEGDNLEVLKLLQKSYYGKIKMIYIDPPYNTGKEFIYPDKYSESLDTYLAYAGLTDGEGRKFSSNTANEGRFHTNWLNMMYPRLYLARNLLTEDGFIVLSIDDAEFKNLKTLCDDVLGEENFLATLVWDKNRKNDAKYFSVGHEYMLVYSKNKQHLLDNEMILREPKEGIEDAKKFFQRLVNKYKNDFEAVQKEWRLFYSRMPNSDPRKKLGRFSKIGSRGPYRDDGNISWPGGGGPKYDVPHPTTGLLCKKPSRGWIYPTKERFWEEYDKGRIVFGEDETTVPRIITYLFESNGQVMPSVFYSYAQKVTQDFNVLMGAKIFDNPKPWWDLRRLVSYLSEDGDNILDFFSGSCTTAHAVLDLNKQDGGNRKFIMVQLPEPCDEKSEAFKAGYKTIADIGKERIRRVISRIEEERAGKMQEMKGMLPHLRKKLPEQDLGFKVLKLDRSNFKVWDGRLKEKDGVKNIEHQLQMHVEHIVTGATQEDLLYELLLKSGFMPTEKIAQVTMADKTIFSIAEGALLICLEDEVTRELIDAVALAEPMRFICLDRAFRGNDELKTNAVQTFAARNQGREKSNQIVFRTV
jgi:adenine-specific DNA-methyltransferase